MRDGHGSLFLYASIVIFAACLCGQDDVREKSPVKSEPQRKEPKIHYLHNPPNKFLPDFQPADDQAPIGGILVAAGDNVSRLFANLFNISAVEKIQQQKLNREGEADPGQKVKYLYLCFGAVDKRDPSFDEYRTDIEGHAKSQLGLGSGYMLTSGFVAAPLIFHPAHQSESFFRMLGFQKLNGRDTIGTAFAQIPRSVPDFRNLSNREKQ